jgi:hypothetical protein
MHPLTFLLSTSRLFLYVCITGLVILTPGARCVFASDHLIPSPGEIDANYREVLRDNLCVTPKDYAQIIVVAGGTTGEHSVAIYSSGKSPTGVFATYTKADKNLGDATWELNPNRKDKIVIKIVRIDAPLPQPVASAVSQVWRELLLRIKPRDITGRATDVVLGGTPFLLSMGKQNGPTMEGIVPPESRGVMAKALKQIDETLISYCMEDSTRREKIAKRLIRETARLSSEIKRAEPNKK